MIPLFAILRIHRQNGNGIRLWLPLFLAWLLLLPLVLLVLLFAFLACLVGKVKTWRALVVGWQLFTGLHDTDIEVAHGQASVLVHVI